MGPTSIKRWGMWLTNGVIAAYLAFLSRDVPWLPKLAVIGIIMGASLAGRMLGETASDVPGLVLSFAGISGAIATMHKLTPPSLMSEFRARASGPVVQSYVTAYFECIAVIAVVATLFAVWQAATE